MSLSQLRKNLPARVMGIDASTNSLAFCILDHNKLVKYGEIQFTGKDIYARLLDAHQKTQALAKEFDVKYVVIEAAVRVNSNAVVIKLAYVFGAIMSVLLQGGAEVREVHPITWQSYIGNKTFTRAETAAFKKSNPGKSASWYKAQIRQTRKQRTMDFFNKKFGVNITSDNVSDAFGIAWYAAHELV